MKLNQRVGLGAGVATLAACVLSATAASAITWDWSASFANGTVTGQGVLTTENSISTDTCCDIAPAPVSAAYTGYLVTAISGTFDGSAVTGLSPLGSNGGNDNLVQTSDQLLDFDGLGFTVADNLALFYDSNQVNLYFDDLSSGGYADSSTPAQYGTFTLTLASGAPEPANWALMVLGMGGIGWRLRSRRRSATIAA